MYHTDGWIYKESEGEREKERPIIWNDRYTFEAFITNTNINAAAIDKMLTTSYQHTAICIFFAHIYVIPIDIKRNRNVTLQCFRRHR